MTAGTAFSSADLLDLIDAGEHRPGIERGDLLLRAALPQIPVSDEIPVGDRDRAIWQLRSKTIRQPAEAVWQCTSCGEMLEIELPADFQVPAVVNAEPAVCFEGQRYALRLPTVGDLKVTRQQGGAFPYERLAPGAPWHEAAFLSAVDAELDAADPGMKLTFNITCAACAASQVNSLDVTDFVWSEFVQLGHKLVSDVLFLAEALGWSETEILSMSAARRGRYIARLQS